MLVLSLTKDLSEEGKDVLHVLHRWCDPERVVVSEAEGEATPELLTERMLLEIIADINQYLPDDWRMNSGSSDWRFKNKTDNGFRIELCLQPGPSLTWRSALIGHSYRLGPHEVLHIVDTVYHPRMISSDAAEAIENEDGRVLEGRIDQGVVERNPELVVANMYYFSPCPDDTSSPLFARQYERVRFDDDKQQLATRQYHRIHPVTKTGLDPDHFRWIQWDIKGNVRFVPQPKPGYRGKTYWGMKRLDQENNRGRSATAYKEQYQKLLEEHGITPQAPVASQSPYETEFKFCVEAVHASQPFSAMRDQIAQMIAVALPHLLMEWDAEKRQMDTYFDDTEATLLRANACFRLRRRTDHIRVTLKKRFPHATEAGLYRRIEEEAVVRESQVEVLKQGQPIQALPFRLIAYVAPGCGPLYEVVVVENKRTIATVLDEGRRRAELCFDELYFYKPGENEKAGPFYEIELESKGMPYETLRRLATTISELPGLKSSQETKYECAYRSLCRSTQ